MFKKFVCFLITIVFLVSSFTFVVSARALLNEQLNQNFDSSTTGILATDASLGWEAAFTTVGAPDITAFKARYNTTAADSQFVNKIPLVAAGKYLNFLGVSGSNRQSVTKTIPTALDGIVTVEMTVGTTGTGTDIFKMPLEIYNAAGDVISVVYLNNSDGTAIKWMQVPSPGATGATGTTMDNSGTKLFNWSGKTNFYKYTVKVVIDTINKKQNIYVYGSTGVLQNNNGVTEFPLYNSTTTNGINVKKILLSNIYTYSSTLGISIDNVKIYATNSKYIVKNGTTEVTNLNAIGSYTASVNLLDVADSTAVMVPCLYDKTTNKLLKVFPAVNTITTDPVTNIKQLTTTFDIVDTDVGKKLRIFTFSNATGIKPIAVSYETN